MACSTQWNIHSTGRVQGLNYMALDVAMRMLDIGGRSVFEDVQVMEYAVLDELNKGV